MKKYFILGAIAIAFWSCETETAVETSTDSIDLTSIIKLETAKASSAFDTSVLGLYKGVFASNDATYHGELIVNLGNDAFYNALLSLTNGDKIGFAQIPNSQLNAPTYQFEGEYGSFTIDVTDVTNVEILDFQLYNQASQAHIIKETSSHPVRMSLGTFVDSTDPTFLGTWDFMSTSTTVIQVPTPLGNFPLTVNVISEVVIMKTGGPMLNDTTMEDFTPGVACPATIPQGTQAPFFSGEQDIMIPPFPAIMLDEYAAGTQTSDFAGAMASWNFLYSKAQGDVYYDIDCNILTGGTWSWNGRSGSISLD